MPPPSILSSRLKAQLKMAINRLHLIQEKDTALGKKTRRDMATLLNEGKEQSAKIRVENIIRSDEYVELLEILELYCELLLARIALLDNRECDQGLEQAVKTIIYCASRTEVKELYNLREIFISKFGKEFAKNALEAPESYMAEGVFKRLKSDPPSQELVVLYLKEIAKAYNAPFSELTDEERYADQQDSDDDDNDDEGNVAETEQSQEKSKEAAETEPIPEPVPAKPKKTTPSFKASSLPNKKVDKDMDDLQKRFEALKQRH